MQAVYTHANQSLPHPYNFPRCCNYSTITATAASAPAAPKPITGPMCTAAPLAFVDGAVVLLVRVCVPLFELEEPDGLVEPPFAAPAAPVVDAVVVVGVDAVLLTEPAVITTGRYGISVPVRVAAV